MTDYYMTNYVCYFEDTPDFKMDFRANSHGHAAEMFCNNWNEKDTYDDVPDPYLITIIVQDVTHWTAPETVIIQGILTWQYEVYTGEDE